MAKSIFSSLAPTLTSQRNCGRIQEVNVYAVKVETAKPSIVNSQLSTEYAGVVELADTLDLGAVTSVKVFPSRCHCEPVRRLVWQSVL